MIQIRDNGKILDPVKDMEAKSTQSEDDRIVEQAEMEAFMNNTANFGPRVHGYE